MPRLTLQQRFDNANSRLGNTRQIPEEFLCMITLVIMEKPVTIRGYSFEQSAIKDWCAANGDFFFQHPIRRRELIDKTAAKAQPVNIDLHKIILHFITQLESEAGIVYQETFAPLTFLQKINKAWQKINIFKRPAQPIEDSNSYSSSFDVISNLTSIVPSSETSEEEIIIHHDLTMQERLDTVALQLGDNHNLPPDLHCKITLELMDDPVTLRGYNFSKAALIRYLRTNPTELVFKHPVTYELINKQIFIQEPINIGLRNIIDYYVRQLEQRAHINYQGNLQNIHNDYTGPDFFPIISSLQIELHQSYTTNHLPAINNIEPEQIVNIPDNNPIRENNLNNYSLVTLLIYSEIIPLASALALAIAQIIPTQIGGYVYREVLGNRRFSIEHLNDFVLSGWLHVGILIAPTFIMLRSTILGFNHLLDSINTLRNHPTNYYSIAHNAINNFTQKYLSFTPRQFFNQIPIEIIQPLQNHPYITGFVLPVGLSIIASIIKWLGKIDLLRLRQNIIEIEDNDLTVTELSKAVILGIGIIFIIYPLITSTISMTLQTEENQQEPVHDNRDNMPNQPGMR